MQSAARTFVLLRDQRIFSLLHHVGSLATAPLPRRSPAAPWLIIHHAASTCTGIHYLPRFPALLA